MDDAHGTPAPLTPDQSAIADELLALITAAGGRPVVSHAGGTHVHAVLPGASDYEQQMNLPYCRREDRRRRRVVEHRGPGDHSEWTHASAVELATLPLCGTCRRRIRRLLEEAAADDVDED